LNAPSAKTWHNTVGDFWGGVIAKFDRYGLWPLVDELFQANQEHRSLPLGADRTEHWQRKIQSRAVPDSDPRYRWGWMIYQTYLGNTPTVTKEEISSMYPYSLKEAIREENAKILAQGLHPDPTLTAKSNKEQAILEDLESSHHEAAPDCIGTITGARKRLLQILRSKNKKEIMTACREHSRMMAEMWDVMSDEAKEAYGTWHADHIRDKGLGVALLDILASPECLKIPLRRTGCPICQEKGIPYNGSSPWVFQATANDNIKSNLRIRSTR
jgi:hypothetical protein